MALQRRTAFSFFSKPGYGVVRRNQGGHGTLPVTIVGQSNADGENVFAPEGRVATGGAGQINKM